jgi:branched-chain amino acid transport system substrate-binding protein
MMSAVAEQLKAHGVKRVGYIGYSDTWGDLVYKAMQSLAKPYGLQLVTDERYARSDTSVTGQVLRLMSANPDAIVVGGSGTGAALPHVALIERGYKKGIYHNHGTVNAEFIKVGGKAVEGAIAPTGPLVVPEELPDSFPTKKVSLDFTKRYEATFGAGTRNAFAGYAYDGYLLLDAAAPAALKKGKPGTPEFREALRDALEGAGREPPSVGELTETFGPETPALLRLLEREGALVQVEEGRYYSAAAMAELLGVLRRTMAPGREYPPGELRDALGFSRKYLIPFLEYADRRGVTERRPGGRVLVGTHLARPVNAPLNAP